MRNLKSKITQGLAVIIITCNVAFSQNKTEYTYSREGKDFHVFNSTGEDITNKIVHISNFNTLFDYVFVPNTKTLLKLSYFSAFQNKISVAEKLLEGKDPNYVYLGENDLFFYCEGKIYTDKEVLMSTPNGRIFVISPKDSNYSYSFLYSKNEFGIVSLDLLPPNNNNHYWSKVLQKGDVSKTDFVIYANGGSPENFENFKIVSGKFLFSIEDKYYKIENFKTAKLYAFNDLHQISKEEYSDLVLNKQEKAKADISTASNDLDSSTKTEPSSYFGCSSDDGNCLVNYFNSRVSNLMKEGKTKDEASKLAGHELDQVFKANPELGYFVIMKVNQELMLGIVGGLSKETRSQLRAMAMSEVKGYEDKYGSQKIKTVPYKPKKDNNN